jgi:glucose/mannose-6-phosphate isomerase
MEKLISNFTKDIVQAIEIARQHKITNSAVKRITNVVICGMGGSGIGASIVYQWVYEEISVPVSICQDYTLPNSVSENTLLIGCSYSGNTEETITAVELAMNKNATIVGICSGGFLETFCLQNKFDCIIIPSGNQPRAALAFPIVQLLHILNSFNLIKSSRFEELLKAKEMLEINQYAIKQEAILIAEKLYGKVGVLIAEKKYEGVAIRAKQQFNENSKYLSWVSIIPEMNHNELVGWGGGDNRFVCLFIETIDAQPKNQKRFVLTKQILTEKTKHHYTLKSMGTTYIERYLYLIHLLDWASFYLVDLNKVDAFDIDVINYLKQELAVN